MSFTIPAVEDVEAVATAMGIPDALIVKYDINVYTCDECGCVFIPDFRGGDEGTVYPDRYMLAKTIDDEPTDHDCQCHAAPYIKDHNA